MLYRKHLIATATCLSAICISSVQASESAIQAHCLEKWSGDAMRAYCLEEQREAADAVAGYSGAIRSRCESEWHADFHMVLFCIKEQQPPSQATVADAIAD
ncbi:hypothetical protein E8F20_27520 [Pseudomonas sp. BN415]|uniref:hypothetical protein n=1 Tax=Pseudomonas sp. BN415 TaxID=2567889 RepID=UPI00245733EC|nr:hypothetical protein [Pseudomonas sp. BN415]MDH4585601.1 hypothetical protein [Pseudomonas sp. BN415]